MLRQNHNYKIKLLMWTLNWNRTEHTVHTVVNDGAQLNVISVCDNEW